jgi:hypothetical protein
MKKKLMNYKVVLVLIVLTLPFGGCQKEEVPFDETGNFEQTIKSNSRVTSLPVGEASYFNIDTNYYKKYTFIGTSNISIPIVSGANVSDLALDRAAILCNLLVRTYPSYALYSLRSQRIYIAIFANNEFPNVLPGWPSNFDASRYGGGFGPTTTFRVCGIHEGDILKNSFDRYPIENIVVHEFSHAIKDFALEIDNSKFKSLVQTNYDNAIKGKKWVNTYAASNSTEYWAECIQSYFNVNTNGPVGGDGVHNEVNTRTELEKYDAGIYKLIDETYKGQVLPAGNW